MKHKLKFCVINYTLLSLSDFGLGYGTRNVNFRKQTYAFAGYIHTIYYTHTQLVVLPTSFHYVQTGGARLTLTIQVLDRRGSDWNDHAGVIRRANA